MVLNMDPKYKIGQEVIVRPVKHQAVPPKDADIGGYAGRMGKVVNYHWIQPSKGKTFYIYTVRLGDEMKEVILHEDELSPF
jgi:hypothetical protein